MTFGLNYTLSLRQVKPDAVFWPVPVMENQFGERRNYFYSKHWLTSGFIVSAASDHHDQIMELFNWMADGEGEVITNWGNEGEHWHRVNGAIEALPEVLDAYRGASDPQRAMRAALGTGLLQFALIVDQKPIYYYDPAEVSDWYAQINSDPNMHPAGAAAALQRGRARAPEAADHRRRQHPQPGARRVHRRHPADG